jgi:hypothetical protein
LTIETICNELIAEQNRISAAITALMGTTTIKRRGRPPGVSSRVAKPALGPIPITAGRKPMSADARAAQSKRMKAYWRKQRKGN